MSVNEPSNGQLRDLVSRLDERVQGLLSNVGGLRNDLARMAAADEQRRAGADRNRRVDRYTMVGIAVALGGVATAVLGIVLNA